MRAVANIESDAACSMQLTLCARVSAMTRLECVRGLVVVLVRPCLPCRDDHADALLLKWECLVGDVPKWECAKVGMANVKRPSGMGAAVSDRVRACCATTASMIAPTLST